MLEAGHRRGHGRGGNYGVDGRRWPLQRKLRRPRPTLPPPPAATAACPEQPSEMATERDGHWQPLIADNWQGGPSNSLFL